MALYHLTNSALDKKFQKQTKGRVVLRGDIVKADSRNYVAFAVQGASASHMTAAKSFGRYFKISRLSPNWDAIDDPVVPLERNLYGHPWGGL